MNDWKEIVKNISEDLGWSVTITREKDDFYFLFSQISPFEQDFNIEVNASDFDELVEEIYNIYDNYDVSYEAYLWLDHNGHGKNGAPYDMKDVYEDMEACSNMVLELWRTLYNYDSEKN